MSDGPSDANRAANEALLIELCADRLADAIEGASDSLFGLPPDMLTIANRELKRSGWKLVKA